MTFLTVIINSAQPLLNTEYLVGSTEVKMFDKRGGVLHSYKHGVTVIIPAGTNPSETLAELKFAAIAINRIFPTIVMDTAVYNNICVYPFRFISGLTDGHTHCHS